MVEVMIQKLSKNGQSLCGMANQILITNFDVVGREAPPEATSFPHCPLPEQRPCKKSPLAGPQSGIHDMLPAHRERDVPPIANNVDKERVGDLPFDGRHTHDVVAIMESPALRACPAGKL